MRCHVHEDVERVRRGAQTICESREGECPRSRPCLIFFSSLFLDHVGTQTRSLSIDPVPSLLDQLGQTPGMRLQVQPSNVYIHPEGKVCSHHESDAISGPLTPPPKKKQAYKNRWGKKDRCSSWHLRIFPEPHTTYLYLTTSPSSTFPRPLEHEHTTPPVRTKSPIRPGAAGTLKTSASGGAHISGAQGGT